MTKKAQITHRPHQHSPEAIQQALTRGTLSAEQIKNGSVDKLRERIRANKIINRLHDHIMSPTDIMSPSQVQAAKILLNKVIPDIKALELSGADGRALPQSININIMQEMTRAEEEVEEELEKQIIDINEDDVLTVTLDDDTQS